MKEDEHRRIRLFGMKPVQPLVGPGTICNIPIEMKRPSRLGAPALIAGDDLLGILRPSALIVIEVELLLRVVQKNRVGHISL